MPTAYTQGIVDGKLNFEQFLLLCCRNFGACIEMRDNSLDAPIPEKFEPSDYHVKSLAQSEAELTRLLEMNNEERIAFGEQKQRESIESYELGLASRRLENGRLAAIREEAEQWEPPTKEHNGLKDFMLQQIDCSMNNESFWLRGIEEAKAQSPMNFYAKAVKDAEFRIEYDRKAIKDEKALATGRTEWIKAVRDSINHQKGKRDE